MKYISRTETAKIIRGELKTSFPKTKFSVRCTPGGSSITVTWVDGPASKAVDAVVKPFEGSTFDGSIDLKSSVYSMYNGEKVRFGADYVSTTRHYSRLFLEVLVTSFCTHWGYDRSKVRFSGAPEDAYANTYNLGGHTVDREFSNLLRRTDAKNAHCPYDVQDEQRYDRTKSKTYAKDTKREANSHTDYEEKKKEAEIKRRLAERLIKEKVYSSRKVPFYTKVEALDYLDLPFSATEAQIVAAFTARVKEAADGRGGYKENMDLVVKAKRKALGV